MSPDIIRYHPSFEELAWSFGGAAPVRRVAPGDALDLFTEDAFGGRIRSTQDRPGSVAYPYVNPQTGPFFVEGAEPGDCLALHLVRVRPARDWGVSTSSPLFGALVGTTLTANLQPNLPERTWVYTLDEARQEAIYQAVDSSYSVRLPLHPFLGTVGVAPAGFEVRSSLVPGPFGGNMDSPEVRAGTTLFLGVNVAGALFSIGDGHYVMGEGEACGVAVEGAMQSLLVVELLKQTSCPWPRLERDDAIMVAGSARPLEDAFRIACTELIRWISGATELSLLDTYQLVSQGAKARIANVCDPNYTIVAIMPKALLPAEGRWMSGTHAGLRATGDALLADEQRSR